MHLFNCDKSGLIFLDSDDGLDDSEDWEDNMDPLSFARHYTGLSNPHLVKMVQDHDCETHACFDHPVLQVTFIFHISCAMGRVYRESEGLLSSIRS